MNFSELRDGSAYLLCNSAQRGKAYQNWIKVHFNVSQKLSVDFFLFQWSFGVTCWEIFNGGKTPYPGISPIDLPHKLETGFRMDKPLNAACSDDVYVIV